MELLSILIPVYNERATLASCLRRVLAVEVGVEREVVVSDDGSTDGSAQVLTDLAESHPEVKAVLLERNRGKGAAIRAAIAEARGTLAVVLDADLEYDPADLPDVIRPILDGRADAVYGSRFATGRERRVLYYRHTLGNRLVTFVSNLLTDLNLTDVETGYKAFRTDLVKPLSLRSNSFAFEIEITAKLAALGARIYEVPVSYHGRTYLEGKKITWVDGIWALWAAVRFRFFPDIGGGRSGALSRDGVRRLKRFNRWLARKVLPCTGDRVIQYAPGAGPITFFLAEKERVMCVEPDPFLARFLKARFGHRSNMRVVEGALDAPEVRDDLRADKPDTLLAVNSLAAAPDDAGLLFRFADLLPAGARLVLVVPRGRWLRSPLDEGSGYLRRYSKKELVEMLVATGFEVERTLAFHRAGTIAWLVWGKILRRRGAWGPFLGLYDRLTLLWRILDYVLPVPGLSLVVVARKKTVSPS
jgi:glycosyltransferase involved in cell wall biosynthesis